SPTSARSVYFTCPALFVLSSASFFLLLRLFFLSMIPPPPRSTLFPYTTLFRSHCITSFFYFYLVASIHQLAGYELYTLSLSILSHNESLIGHMLCITNMCDINTSLINLSRRVYRCQWINGY